MAVRLTAAAAKRLGITKPTPPVGGSAKRSRRRGISGKAVAPSPALPQATGEITIDLPFVVVPKERHRSGAARGYTPKRTLEFCRTVADHGRIAMRGFAPFHCPIEVWITFVLPVPPSWEWRWQAAARSGRVLPTRKPDLDNATKAIWDSLNGVAWADDAVVVRTTQEKVYGDVPKISVRLRPIPGAVGSTELRRRLVSFT